MTINKSKNKTINYNFKNGLRLVYDNNNDKLTTIRIFFKVGSITEQENEAGISHLIEHLIFKGSKNTEFNTSYKLSRYFDERGAFINAYTDKDATCYYVKGNSDYAHDLINGLGHILKEPNFHKADFLKEKNVVLEELRGDNDDPEFKIYKMIEEIVYKEHKLSRPIIGSIDTIKSITLEQVKKYYEQYYCIENMVISVCSDLSFSTIKNYINSSPFLNFNKSCIIEEKQTPFIPSIQEKYQLHFINDDVVQTYITISFPVASFNGLEKFGFYIIENYLTGTMSSRLFMELREKRGLSYSVSSNYSGYNDVGSFTISTSVDSNRVIEAISVIFTEIKKLIKNGISKSEIEYLKKNINARYSVVKEDSAQVTDFNGTNVLLGITPPINLAEVPKYITELEDNFINQLPKSYFINKNMAMVVLGNLNKDDKNNIQKYVEKHI